MVDVDLSILDRDYEHGLIEAVPTRSDLIHDRRMDHDDKLALLLSIFEHEQPQDLLQALNEHDGNVEGTIDALSSPKRPKVIATRSSKDSLASLKWSQAAAEPRRKNEAVLELHTPAQIEAALPCTIIHNILPATLAKTLLVAMLEESDSWTKGYFKLFDRTVTSPHVSNFYLQTQAEIDKHVKYVYNGQPIDGIRAYVPDMFEANRIIEARTRDWLEARESIDQDWRANVAFANMYNGRDSAVGYHSDQLSFIGPLPVIASLSLGCEREFRLKPVSAAIGTRTLSVKLPHNSLFIMGEGCQEDYKHAILPVGATKGLDLHPVAGVKRINITYRKYRAEYSPEFLPHCSCGQAVLRSAKASDAADATCKPWHGRRYFWHCDGDKRPGGVGCKFFQWADFTSDGRPIL